MAISRIGIQFLALSFGAGSLAFPVNTERTRLTVQVLDSKTGKPVSDNHIVLFTGATPEDAHTGSFEATTDSSGLAVISLDLQKSKFAQLWVDWHSRCEKTLNFTSFNLQQAHDHGLILNRCSTLTSSAKPDLLTVYVRPETFWEKMEH